LNKNKGHNKKLGLKYYRKKQYVKAVSYFENVLRTNKDDYEVYKYLGYASIFSGDMDGARSYLKSGLLIKDDADLLKGLAYVYLKDERIEDAINLWCEVLEKNPRDKRVKAALEGLRGSEDVKDFIDSARPCDFFSTKPPFYIKAKPYLLGISITFGIIILGIIFYTTPLYRKMLEKFYPELVMLNRVEFPKNSTIIEEDVGDAYYVFSEKEIEESFVRVKKYIYKGKVNTAIISLNRIMLSNASPIVKERFKILYKFINPPDSLSIDYNPRYFEIMKEPIAYKGVYIRWMGKIANLKKDKQSASFDFLVSYEDEDTIEGIVHVDINGTFYIENKQKVEVFGVFDNADKEKGKLFINGILLRDLRLK